MFFDLCLCIIDLSECNAETRKSWHVVLWLFFRSCGHIQIWPHGGLVIACFSHFIFSLPPVWEVPQKRWGLWGGHSKTISAPKTSGVVPIDFICTLFWGHCWLEEWKFCPLANIPKVRHDKLLFGYTSIHLSLYWFWPGPLYDSGNCSLRAGRPRRWWSFHLSTQTGS